MSKRRRSQPKPVHYRVVCMSLYERDLELLNAQVQELKSRGMTRANASAVVRLALAQLDLDAAMREPAMPGRTLEQVALITKHAGAVRVRGTADKRSREAEDNAPPRAAEGA
jgi:hypothetical protein